MSNAKSLSFEILEDNIALITIDLVVKNKIHYAQNLVMNFQIYLIN